MRPKASRVTLKDKTTWRKVMISVRERGMSTLCRENTYVVVVALEVGHGNEGAG